MKALAVGYNDINSAMRLDSSYHLSVGTIYLKKLRSMPHNELKDITSNIFTAGRSKRVYTQEQFGYPYLSNSDVVKQSPLDASKYNSKKFGYDSASFLKEGMTVTGRVGAIGQSAYISSELEDAQAMGSDNIIRIVPRDITYAGFIYAFIASKYGNNLIWRLAAGGVQPYISEDMLKDMPIPNLTNELKWKIHSLIDEASTLRVEANKVLNEANRQFHDLNEITYENYHLTVSENAKYYGFKHKVSNNSVLSIKAKNHSRRILEIKEIWNTKPGIKLKDYLSAEFRIGPRGSFKRIDSDSVGVEMVSQSDIHRINPKNFKRVIISREHDEDFGKDSQVLFPAVGNGSSEGEILFRPTLAYKTFTKKLLSGDIGRLDCPTLEHAAYLLVALKSKGGFRMMRAFYYGTQLRRPLWEFLKEIKIPIKNDQVFSVVSNLAIKAYDLRHDADIKENEAIALLEKQIESWQKS
ncbi:hypothetical protein [Roseivirga pacifica]|uniref:hypothetical protein n=1 Tax=Roseivirga pacifica TaxID=1267423 RepID=UPI002095E03D|nr:hypothetical protein [Roseivirga pacifica]MCO6359036.1 hypothetical protein [Roseivirga pacifica]MCO6365328.1 hypothetical protein [Roseivirga pacifica]MCO6371942.1 hypothetical protein [Roseivirga pacifica]MCO6375947.1 hypothetical protein [Roseivirga pacifica]MCO6379320.1 hypothetical protein [Roseivirga pacifica]